MSLDWSASSTINVVDKLSAIGVALSGGLCPEVLVDMIITEAMDFIGCDAASVYSLEDGERLKFEIVKNKSLGIFMGGVDEEEISFPAISLYDEKGNKSPSVVANSILSEKTTNIKNAYDSKEFDFSGTKEFDEKTGYKSKSFLTVPMKNHEDAVIGVMQFINAIDISGKIVSFTEHQQLLAESLASQAATALTRILLVDEMKELFESFVQMIATTIDKKSPYTGGHCRRIPILTEIIANAVNESKSEAFNDVVFTESELYELSIASWLHDCGKIITPEWIVEKATRLSGIYDRIDVVVLKLELMQKDLIIKALRENKKEDCFENSINEIESIKENLQKINSSGFLSDENETLVKRIEKEARWINSKNEIKKVIEEDDLEKLTIKKGTLTKSERETIEKHVSVTKEMLDSLPLPKQLNKIPEIAGSHHERVDGKGYPNKLKKEDMLLQSRILAIADIYEALTAEDRPYKKPIPVQKAIGILESMKDDGHIDPDIFELFVEEKLYEKYHE